MQGSHFPTFSDLLHSSCCLSVSLALVQALIDLNAVGIHDTIAGRVRPTGNGFPREIEEERFGLH